MGYISIHKSSLPHMGGCGVPGPQLASCNIPLLPYGWKTSRNALHCVGFIAL